MSVVKVKVKVTNSAPRDTGVGRVLEVDWGFVRVRGEVKATKFDVELDDAVNRKMMIKDS